MTMTDPVADMLTRLRNANSAHHDSVSLPSSKLKTHIAEILKREGYIAGWEVEDARVGQTLTLDAQVRPEPRAVDRRHQARLEARPPRLREVDRDPHACSVASASPSCPPPPVFSPTARPSKKGVGGEVLAYVW